MNPDGGLDLSDIHLTDGVISTPESGSAEIDCAGLYILPGIVDVHGDGFEHALFPRPGVEIDFSIAMHSVDRQLLAHGITTVFHGLTVSWEPGTRSLEQARRFMAQLKAARAGFLADHRVQLRWEVSAVEAMEDISHWLSADPTPSLAFNDHLSETMDVIEQGNTEKLRKWASRAGISLEAYVETAKIAHNNALSVDSAIAEMAGVAARNGAKILAHDEGAPLERERNRAMGMQVSEFPMTLETARNAVTHGEHVVMGAPNVLRGESHKGLVSARDAIRSKACTILASDYYYPAPLHAVEMLVKSDELPLEAAWDLVSRNPAQAMGLIDRGEIDIGKRADLVVLDLRDQWRVVHTLSGGRLSSFGI